MSLYIGDTNLTIGQTGKAGLNGANGSNGVDGKSAYQIAQEAGYNGTEEEFGESLSKVVEVQMLFCRFNIHTTWDETETVYTSTWAYDGDNYKVIMTELSDTQYKKQLFINDVTAGTWTLTIDEINRISDNVYTAT